MKRVELEVGRPLLEEVRSPEPTAETVATHTPPRKAEAAVTAEVNPYTGAGTTSLNVRILVPVHTRYRKLVRDLEDEGYRTSSTELFHALLHFGPTNTAEARDLLRRWRAVLDADPSATR